MDKLVFITGASSGIGQALAWRYHQAGWRLALVARRTAEIEALGARQAAFAADRYAVYGADVADTDSIVAAGRACLARQGVPDVVIANAGISIGVDTAVREDIDVIARTFATNNVGLAATFHPFIAPMTAARLRARWWASRSVAGIRGLPGHGAYCASKAAVISYCESLRGELRSSGVKVVTICPGYVDTPLTRAQPLRHAVPDAAAGFRRAGVPGHRSGHQLPRHPMADGRRREAAALAAECAVRPGAGRPAAQAPAEFELSRGSCHAMKKAPEGAFDVDSGRAVQ